VLVFGLTSYFPVLCVNTFSTRKCHCDKDSWLQWDSTFQALCWVRSAYFLWKMSFWFLKCWPFGKSVLTYEKSVLTLSSFLVVEGMWQWVRIIGRTCFTILLNQRVNLLRTLWFCGLMGDLAALVLMDSYMSMVRNCSLSTLPFFLLTEFRNNIRNCDLEMVNNYSHHSVFFTPIVVGPSGANPWQCDESWFWILSRGGFPFSVWLCFKHHYLWQKILMENKKKKNIF